MSGDQKVLRTATLEQSKMKTENVHRISKHEGPDDFHKHHFNGVMDAEEELVEKRKKKVGKMGK